MIKITTQILSTVSDTGKARFNDRVGQMKDALLSTGLFTVISDNNPISTTYRTIVMKYANSNHYFRIYHNADYDIEMFMTLKLDNSTINFPDNYPDIAFNNVDQSITIIYSDKFMSVSLNNSQPMIWFELDDTSWFYYHVKNGYRLLSNSDEQVYDFLNFNISTAFRKANNSFPIVQVRLMNTLTSKFLDVAPLGNMYNINSTYITGEGMINGKIYVDGSGNEYYFWGNYLWR